MKSIFHNSPATRLLAHRTPLVLGVLTIFAVSCKTVRHHADIRDVGRDVQRRVADSGVAVKLEPDRHLADERKRTLDEKPLGLRNAIQIALLNNPQLLQDYEALGVERAALRHATILRNPTIHFDILESFEDEESVPLFVPGVGFVEPDTRDAQFHFSVTMDFIDVIRRHEMAKVSRARMEVEKMRLSEKVIRLITDVSIAVYTYQGESMKLSLMQKVLDGVAVRLEMALEQHRVGNISDLTLAGHQAAYQDITLKRTDQQRNVTVARERINQLLGFWGESTAWSMPTELTRPGSSVSDESVDRAISNSLAIEAAMYEIGILKRELGVNKATIIPALELGLIREEEDFHIPASGVSGALEIPIFDRNQTEVERYTALLRQKEHELSSIGIHLRSEFRLLRELHDELIGKIEYYESAVLPLKSRIVKLSLEHYNGMFLGPYALLEAKMDELRARKAYVEILKKYWITRAELDHVLAGGRIGDAAMEPVADTAPAKKDGHGGH